MACDLVLAQLPETSSHARKLFADFVAGEVGKGQQGRGASFPRYEPLVTGCSPRFKFHDDISAVAVSL
ncbi:MAG: hypothetical protein WCY59_09335, partial [Anaerovoracaceae bacterium]